ncbi:TPA: dihydrofolate reductase [Candidatus Woesearchaeota archaeon]|nr:dihydrofolate reductase [Candidatus Woesearchaeota archaeon]HIH41422.1 dihydrofolate reductase [Candidatus Woesearchaeota archaeon]
MALSMIWAMGKNRELGKDLQIPWHIPEDFKHFKKTTMGKPVIMGLTTFRSLGKPLPGRRNIILSFEKMNIPGCEVFISIQGALATLKHDDEAFIMGGASIYRQFLPTVGKLYMTYIDHNFDANIFFPEFDMKEWKLISEEKGPKNEKNPYDYYFRVYERKKGKTI